MIPKSNSKMKGKKINYLDWMTAYQIAKNGCSSVDDLIITTETADRELRNLCIQPDAEHQCIKNDMYSRISSEAKEVISLIMCAPSELLDEILKPNGFSRKERIIKYLKNKHGWNLAQTKKCMQELKEYVTCL
jgi:hypothetical protein